jgi:hypothetical protein
LDKVKESHPPIIYRPRVYTSISMDMEEYTYKKGQQLRDMDAASRAALLASMK